MLRASPYPTMATIVRNILAVVIGLMAGGLVNMGLVMLGPKIFPPPAGANLSTPEGLQAAMPLLGPEHFVFPFLAHALNAFVGALVVYLMAASRRTQLPWIVGGLTLIGGIAAALMIPAPLWFEALDIIVAYLPMTCLAIKVGQRLKPETPAAPAA